MDKLTQMLTDLEALKAKAVAAQQAADAATAAVQPAANAYIAAFAQFYGLPLPAAQQ